MDPRLLQRLEEAGRNPPPVASPNTPQEGNFAGTVAGQLPFRLASPSSQVGLQRPRRPPPQENLQIAQQHGSSPLPSLDRPHTLPHHQADLSSLVSQIENYSISDDLWTRTGNLLNENRASVREVILDSLCRRHRAPGIAPLLELEHIVMRTCQLFDCQCVQELDVLTLLVQEEV